MNKDRPDYSALPKEGEVLPEQELSFYRFVVQAGKAKPSDLYALACSLFYGSLLLKNEVKRLRVQLVEEQMKNFNNKVM